MRILAASILIVFLVFPISIALAAFSTHSLDLELSSSQYATAVDSASLSVTGDMTIEAWINFESLGATNQVIVAKSHNTSGERSYIARITSSTASLDVSASGNSFTNAGVSFVASTATWYHMAWVYDASAGQLEFFVDGVSQGTASGLDTSIKDGSRPFAVGAREDDSAYGLFFDGKITLLRLWSETRTGTQLSTNDCSILGSTSNLQGEWTFSNVYTDNSGNSNTLTAVNSPVFSTEVPSVCGGAFNFSQFSDY